MFQYRTAISACAGACALAVVAGAPTSSQALTTIYNFAVTTGSYVQGTNLNNAVAAELGSKYRVADWNDIIDYVNSGYSVDDPIFSGLNYVTVSGSNHQSGSRYYYTQYSTRPGQAPYDGFMSYGNVGQLYLGAWTNTIPILAYTSDTMPVARYTPADQTFSSSQKSLSFISTSFDPDDGLSSYAGMTAHHWKPEAGANQTGSALGVASLEESGIANTRDTGSITLTAYDNDGNSSSNAVTLSYENSNPLIVSMTATNNADGSVTFRAVLDDPDLGANGLINFDDLAYEWDDELNGDLSDGLFTSNWVSSTGDEIVVPEFTMSYEDLLAVYGTSGTYTMHLSATDRVGSTIVSNSVSFSFEDPIPSASAVPIPGVAGLLGLSALVQLAAKRRK